MISMSLLFMLSAVSIHPEYPVERYTVPPTSCGGSMSFFPPAGYLSIIHCDMACRLSAIDMYA